jgi:hypothetical protein
MVPSVTWSLIALALVVLFTMKVTGGIGIRSLGGSSYGGKKYFYILFAIAGYFAMSCQRIPGEKVGLYSGAFFLSGLTPLLSNVVYMLGPAAWFLFAIFPVETAMGQASEDFAAPGTAARIGRIGGLAFASTAGVAFMVARYGVRGIFDLTRPLRLICFIGLNVAGMLGGFRSVLILNALVFAIQFFAEGHHRNRSFPLLLAALLAASAILVPFADRLPMSVQRTLSFLPIELSAVARLDAQASTDWRLQMWSVLWPEIGRYFWVGKGYTASATDYYLALESFRRGLGAEYDVSLVAGDYHSGPLSVMIPFGIFGVLAFLWFLGASLRVLYLNMRYGEERFRTVNTGLFAIFLARTISFLFIFGGIHSDIVVLVGLIAIGVSINGGVRRAPASASTTAVAPQRDGPGRGRGRGDGGAGDNALPAPA